MLSSNITFNVFIKTVFFQEGRNHSNGCWQLSCTTIYLWQNSPQFRRSRFHEIQISLVQAFFEVCVQVKVSWTQIWWVRCLQKSTLFSCDKVLPSWKGTFSLFTWGRFWAIFSFFKIWIKANTINLPANCCLFGRFGRGLTAAIHSANSRYDSGMSRWNCSSIVTH